MRLSVLVLAVVACTAHGAREVAPAVEGDADFADSVMLLEEELRTGNETAPNGTSNASSNPHALFPSDSYCAPPDCVETDSAKPVAHPSVALTGPAPGIPAPDGNLENPQGAPQYEPKGSSAPGLVVTPRAGDPGGPKPVTTRGPLSGANNSGAPQYTNSSEEETAPLYSPPPPAEMPVAENVTLNNGTKNHSGVVAVEINEETTNLTGTSTPEPQVPEKTFENQKDGKLAPGCKPGESPNTASGCDHDYHEEVHYAGDEKEEDQKPVKPAKDHETPSAAESKDTPAKDKTGELPVRLGEEFHVDYPEEKKRVAVQSQKAGEERGAKRNAALEQNSAAEEAQDFEHLKGRVIRRENYAKYFVKTHEKNRKSEKREVSKMSSRKTIDEQLASGAPVPVSEANTTTNVSAPLANETAVRDRQGTDARDASFEASNKEKAAKRQENKTLEDAEYQQEYDIAYPEPVGTKPPDTNKADKAWDYLNHDEYENKQHTFLKVNEEAQTQLDADRERGANLAPGYNGNVSSLLTPERYKSAERDVKLNRAQYDRGEGKPVEREKPRKVYKHEEGADVIAVQAPSNEAPQYAAPSDTYDPPPPDEHGPVADAGGAKASLMKPSAKEKPASDSDVMLLDSV